MNRHRQTREAVPHVSLSQHGKVRPRFSAPAELAPSRSRPWSCRAGPPHRGRSALSRLRCLREKGGLGPQCALRLRLQHCVRSGCHCKKDVKLLESVRRRAAGLGKGLLEGH